MPNTRSGRRHPHVRRGNPRPPIARNIPPPVPPHLRLTGKDINALKRSRDDVARRLEEGGFTRRQIHAALQYDLNDIINRLSAACPYEQERCRRIVQHRFANRTGEAFMVTVGNPRLRVPLDRIDAIKVQATLRIFHTACARLHKAGYSVRGFAVFELHACFPEEGEPFWEPHLHALVWGAPKEALEAAFTLRVLKATTLRRRPVHIRRVTDLDGALGYLLKFRPTLTNEYESDAGGSNWGDDDMPRSLQPQWHALLARHRMAQLLTARAENVAVLHQSMKCELS